MASISAQGMHFQTLPTLHRSRNAFPTQLWTVPADKVQRSGKQNKDCISNHYPHCTDQGMHFQHKLWTVPADQVQRSGKQIKECISKHYPHCTDQGTHFQHNSGQFLLPADRSCRSSAEIKECISKHLPTLHRSRNAFPTTAHTPQIKTEQGTHFQMLLHRSRQIACLNAFYNNNSSPV